MQRKRLLLIWSGRELDTSHQLFLALREALSANCDPTLTSNSVGYRSAAQKFWNNFRENISRIPVIAKSDAILLHSYASLSIISVIAARLLSKKILIFHWDVYPTTIDGVRRSGLVRLIADTFENFAVKLATTVIIPSKDFLGFVNHHNLVEIPLWPSITPTTVKTRPAVSPIRIAFVGQLDISRGVESFVEWAGKSSQPIELNIFSGTLRLQISPEHQGSTSVIYHPKMQRTEVQEILRDMHLGLVSLNKRLDQPGFPSKVFDYVAANVPVIYFGRPLPAFTQILTDTGVGEIISDDSNLKAIYQRLTHNWDQSREKFLKRTSEPLQRILDYI